MAQAMKCDLEMWNVFNVMVGGGGAWPNGLSIILAPGGPPFESCCSHFYDLKISMHSKLRRILLPSIAIRLKFAALSIIRVWTYVNNPEVFRIKKKKSTSRGRDILTLLTPIISPSSSSGASSRKLSTLNFMFYHYYLILFFCYQLVMGFKTLFYIM